MRKIGMMALLLSGTALAFDSGTGWKKDASGALVVDGEGNPVFVGDDGAERSVKGDTISRLNGEARDNRLRAEKAEEAFKAFEGLDAAKAREALATLSKIDTKALIDAGEVDRVRQEIGAGFQKQLDEANAGISQRDQRINDMTLDAALARSDFLATRLAIPRELVEPNFRQHFEVREGKVVAKDKSGNVIYSKKAMGEVAGVDEAFEVLLAEHPHRDQILRANVGAGSGSSGGGGQRITNRIITRTEFGALNPTEQAAAAAEMRAGNLTIQG